MHMLKVYFLKTTDMEGHNDNDFQKYMDRGTWEAANRPANPRTRRTKILSRALVHGAIRKTWGWAPGDYRITTGEHGKPRLTAPDSEVFFNLSHSGDYILCAVSSQEVGVDIEYRGKARLEVARRFFHPHEARLLQDAPAEQQVSLFFDYWAAKESYLKYTGDGLSGSMSAFEICFAKGDAWIEKGHTPLPVRLRACPIDENYSSFICCEKDEPFTIEPFLF